MTPRPSDDDRAIRWLAGQLHWEAVLERLRAEPRVTPVPAPTAEERPAA